MQNLQERTHSEMEGILPKIGQYEVSPEIAKLNPQAFEGTGDQAPKQNKYHSKRVTAEGRTFDSGREAARAGELLLLHQHYRIFALAFQVNFPLMGGGRYVADFVYLEKRNGQLTLVVEDAKSKATKTPLYKRSKKQFYATYKTHIEEV